MGPDGVRCCPLPGQPADKKGVHEGTSCIKDRKGTCIDAATTRCADAATLKGHCSGPAAIVCCPEPGYGAALAGVSTPAPVVGGACLYDRPGVCIDMGETACEGAAVLTGYCKGAGHVRCCPQPGFPEKVPATSAPIGSATTTTISPHSGTPCSKGKSGVCIDTLQQSCGGAATLTNFCPGAAHVRCCPAPGKVGAAVPVADNACTVGADAPAGTCIDTAVVDCAGAGTTSGTVAPAWRACPSLPNKTRAVCVRLTVAAVAAAAAAAVAALASARAAARPCRFAGVAAAH